MYRIQFLHCSFDNSVWFLHLKPLNNICSNHLPQQEKTKITTASWIFTLTKKMTLKWQKSLSAVEIDYDDGCTLHSSWGDGSVRWCFSNTVTPMKISLMPVYQCKPCLDSKAQMWEQIHHRMKGCSTSAGDSDTSRQLCLSHTQTHTRTYTQIHTQTQTHLLAFSSVSHLLTLLLITVGDLNDPAQWATTINAQFLLPQPQGRLSGPVGECQRLIRLQNAIFQGLAYYKSSISVFCRCKACLPKQTSKRGKGFFCKNAETN